MLFRRFVAVVALLALMHTYAYGFDTYWHSEAARKVGDEFGFSEDSRKIMQLGNFSPDFFGPVSDCAAQNLPDKRLQSLSQYGSNNQESRAAAIFLHFDNLNSELDSNAKFDYIFQHLLQNTQSALAGYFKNTGVDERTRKVLVLIALGASLHAVQDFYSHSDWIHHDFTTTEAKLVPLPGGGSRAPTWFEFRAKSPDVTKWPFQVQTGLYPPVAGVGPTHTHMNHDNSRLIYREYETPGAPLLPEVKYHVSGNVPAKENDAAAIAAHQQFAFNTAVAASIEWVRKVEENADAKAAIEFAKSWNLKLKDPKLAKELEAGLATQLALSCAAGKWDGEDPPADRGVLCKTVLDQSIGSASATSASSIESILLGTVTRAAFPLALKYTGKFWDVHRQYRILDSLVQNIGSPTRHYVLSKP